MYCKKYNMKKKIFSILLIGILIVSLTGCGSKDSKGGSTNNGALYPVQTGATWGYVNAKGKMVIESQYETAYGFYEGLAAVVKDNKMGYINNKGEYVIEPQFELPPEARTYDSFYRSNFDDGIAAVLTGSISECIYIDKTGKNIFDKTFYECGRFNNGVAAVMPEYGETIYIDKNGNEVDKPEKKDFGIKTVTEWIDNKPKEYFVKENGEKLIDTMFDRASDFNSLGYSIVTLNDEDAVIDTTGNYVIDFGEYDYFNFDPDNHDMIISEKNASDGHLLAGLYDVKNKKELVESKYSNYYLYDDVYIFRESSDALIVKKDGTIVSEFTV